MISDVIPSNGPLLTLIFLLRPVTTGEFYCEFSPGPYIPFALIDTG